MCDINVIPAPTKRMRFFFAAAVALVMVVIGGFLAIHASKEKASHAPALPVIADLGGDFELTRTDGARVRLQDYRDKVVLLFFGYTFCPDLCPMSLYTLKLAVEELGKTADRVQVIMVTVDPERDNPKHLAEYLQYFHPKFVGLSGTPGEIQRVARQYHVQYQKNPLPTGGYSMSHSSFIYLLDGTERVRALFGAGVKEAEIVDGVRHLLADG